MRILSFSSEKDTGKVEVELDHDAITRVINDERCHNLPFLVISINGVKRAGKSFLVNLLILYLQHLENVSLTNRILSHILFDQSCVVSHSITPTIYCLSSCLTNNLFSTFPFSAQ